VSWASASLLLFIPLTDVTWQQDLTEYSKDAMGLWDGIQPIYRASAKQKTKVHITLKQNQ